MKKSFESLLSILIFSVILFGCNNSPLSHKMRTKYREALQHYSLPQDSLKQKALLFLLENMDDKSGVDPASAKKWVSIYRELYTMAQDEDFNFKHDYLKDMGIYPEPQYRYVNDTEIITSSDLIENIDLAFEAWEKPWAKHLTFDEFCSYVLPYRIKKEPYCSNWRSFLKEKLTPLTDSLEKAGVTNPFKVCEAMSVFLHLKSKAYIPPLPNINVVDYYDYPIGDCHKWQILHCLAARAIGIPLAIDFNLQFTRFPGSHPGTVLTNDGNGKLISFVMNFDHTVLTFIYDGVKIYREEFAKQPSNLVNHFFYEHQNKNIKDVTIQYSHHFPKLDVNLPMPEKKWEKDLYLCCFGIGEKIVPIDLPEIEKETIHLKNLLITTESLFLLCSYNKFNSKFTPLSNPFSITTDGKLHLFEPEQKTETIKIRRKYPRSYDEENYFRQIQGARIQGSNDRLFKQAITLDSAITDPLSLYEFFIPEHTPFLYYRYLPPTETPINLAELHFYYNNTTDKIITYYSEDVNDTSGFHNLYDDDNSSNYITKEHRWIGIDISNTPELKLSKVGVLARNSLNNIAKDNLYELFYFDKKWISLGKRKANGLLLEWDNVPINAIFLLKNHTEGAQERIFMSENGEQNFF